MDVSRWGHHVQYREVRRERLLLECCYEKSVRVEADVNEDLLLSFPSYGLARGRAVNLSVLAFYVFLLLDMRTSDGWHGYLGRFLWTWVS